VENRRRRPTLALDLRAVLSSVHSSPMPSIALIGALVLALKQTGTTALFSVPTSPMPVPTCSLMAMNEPVTSYGEMDLMAVTASDCSAGS
jgi:hypothetical protein